MTAPARPVLRLDRPPTRAQLLVLADRAERGALTAAEADRLRQGIAAMYFGSRSAGSRAAARTRQQREAGRRLAAIAAVIRAARQRGARAVPVQILDAALYAEVQLPPPVARQKLSAPA
ncbi:hypothetical protein AB0F20_05595 [Streptomyces goshikiensis]|uniref:hypothetical protein n=1 Tax=Streptomyces goshikiensis TaxID=1942 RepID=UPI0033DE4DFC